VTPVGHLAIGLSLGHGFARRRAWTWAPWATAIGAVLPDVDFLLVWSSHFNAWHRVITHNLAFVLATSGLLAYPLSRFFRAPALPIAFVLVLGGLTHLAVDACIDANASNGVGVALWWPFDARMVSPLNLVAPSDDPRGWSDPAGAVAAAMRGFAWELPWIALAAWLLLRARRAG
jgi:membrane-bound metal-dependent hydrolase YbcI (DUF457 family)